MSFQSSRSGPPLQTTLPITFIIIGGGIAGLACALALRRVGHHVLVCERTSRDAARGNSGVRLPPNLTKILFHWGLRDALMSKAAVTTRLRFMKYETSEVLGEHIWDQEMLKETRGLFLMMEHAELYDILYDRATRLGAEVRFNATVAEVDAEEREVMLESGERISADVIIGADGVYGASREAVLGRKDHGTPTGVAVYDIVIPTPDLPVEAVEFSSQTGQFVAFGSEHAIVAYPIHHTEDYAFQLYAPDTEGGGGQYSDVPKTILAAIAGDAAPILKVSMSGTRTKATRVSVHEHRDIEDWVSDDGRLVLIGEAAHPFPASTIQGTAMAVEDGAVLAKLFSHLSEERQIESFLYAFQELRQARVCTVRSGEFNSVFYMIASGPEAEQRDAGMRAKAAKGQNVLDGDGGVESVWEEYRIVFGYDCEDEADDWWVQWGMLRERALNAGSCEGGAFGGRERGASLLDFSAAMKQVQVTSTEEDCY